MDEPGRGRGNDRGGRGRGGRGGRGGRNSFGGGDDQQRPSNCYKCGEEGHWANKCTNIANRGQANTGNGTQANKNLNKDALMIVKLKKKVHDLKDILNNKELELSDLRKLMKSTKLKEMEIENRTILSECFRLRAIAENSIKLSGEIDVEKMRRDR